MGKLKILFLCTGNSCRSQMAEGWARYLKGDVIEPFSAGIEAHGMNPSAISVMAEAGIDISSHQSKLLSDLPDREFDYVVTVCGYADASCPIFPGNSVIVHRGFPDPPLLARKVADGGGGAQEELDCYRQVRDQIKTYITTLPESLYE